MTGKRQLGRHRNSGNDNIKFTIKTLNGKEYGPDWCVSGLGYGANSCECGDTHSGSIKCGETLD